MLVFSAGRLGVTGTSMPGGKMDQILSISFGISIFMIAFVVFSAIFDGRLYTLKRAVKIIILGICVFAVFYETLLTRTHPYAKNYNLELFWSYKLAIAGNRELAKEIILNILLYIPLGFMMPAVFSKSRAWKLILTMFIFSVFIETLQLVTRLGLFEFDDMFDNTLGGIIGLIAYGVLKHWGRAGHGAGRN